MCPDVENGNQDFCSLVRMYENLLPSAELELVRPHQAFRWKGKLITNVDFSIWRMRCEGDWTLRPHSEPEGLCVLIPTAGAIEIDLPGKKLTATPGTALVSGIYEISQMRSHGVNSRVVLKWSGATVNKVLSQTFEGVSLPNIGIVPPLDLTGAKGQMLQCLVRAITLGLHGENPGSAKISALISEAALQLIFEQFPSTFVRRGCRSPEIAAPRHLDAAIDFMRAHLHEPLTVGSIAEASGVSHRSLQIAFQRFLDTSPLAYLRDLRLREVHAELMRPENMLPIGEVASKWGFAHTGRFVARYRATYGVLPSETSRLARRDKI